MTYFVTPGDDLSDFAASVNYVLANLPQQGLTLNEDAGQLVNPNTSQVYSYLFKYIAVMFANDALGTGLSNIPTNKQYYGIRNSQSLTESTNPADYSWTQVTGGFGTTKFLWFYTNGGKQISFFAGTSAPSVAWEQVPLGVIDIDRLTTSGNTIVLDRRDQQYFIAPNIQGNWTGISGPTITCTATTVNPSNNASNTIDTVTVQAVVNQYGQLSYIQGSNSAFTISLQGAGTTQGTVTFIHRIGTVTAYVFSAADFSAYGTNLSFDFQYLALKFADSLTPTDATIYNNPDGHRYVGVQSSPSQTGSALASAYIWYDLGSTLSSASSNFLFGSNNGNRIVSFKVQSNNPDSGRWTNVSSLYTGSQLFLDLDSRSGLVVLGGYSTGGNYATTPVLAPSGSIAYSLPQLFTDADFGAGNDTQEFSGVTTLTIDRQGRIKAFETLDNFRAGYQVMTVPSSGTTFDFNHVVGQAFFTRNGSLLKSTDFTETSTSVTIPSFVTGDSIIGWRFASSQSSGTPVYVPFTRFELAIVPGQTSYTVGAGFTAGAELLFYNGVFMTDSVYDYSTDKTQIVLNFNPLGGTLVIISFRQLNGSLIPFIQGTGSTTGGQQQVLTGSSLQQTGYTPVAMNGVTLRPVLDYSTSAGSSSVTLTVPAAVTNSIVEATAFAANGVATMSSGIGSDTNKVLFKGMEMAHGYTLKEVGSEDPSKDSNFHKAVPPPTLAEKFEELWNTIHTLKTEIQTLKESN